MDYTNPETLFFIGSTLLATAMVGLAAMYFNAKMIISRVKNIVVELSELLIAIDKALRDDNLTKEESAAIMAELNDLIKQLKKTVKLITKEPQE